MTVQLKADPGIGRESAPVGTRAWAERVRLHMQGLVSSVRTKPEALTWYIDLVKEHQAWTLMNKDDGSFFKTFEEFCEYRQPWGLGKPWPELKPFIVAVCGGNTAVAAAVSTSADAAGSDGGKRAGAGRPYKDSEPHINNQTDNGKSDCFTESTATNDGKPRRSHGNSAEYLASRIARDFPEVFEQLKSGVFRSVRAAGVAVGIVKPPDPVTVAKRALSKVPAERAAELYAQATTKPVESVTPPVAITADAPVAPVVALAAAPIDKQPQPVPEPLSPPKTTPEAKAGLHGSSVEAAWTAIASLPLDALKTLRQRIDAVIRDRERAS
jgi:hypothetical protein